MSLIQRSNGKSSKNSPFFNDFFLNDFVNWSDANSLRQTVAAANILEKDDSYQIELAAPGLSKQDFNIELNDYDLSISVNRKQSLSSTDENITFTRREFRYENFSRRFSLPKDEVDVDKIQAKYEDGILYILIPKKEEAKTKPPRRIDIS